MYSSSDLQLFCAKNRLKKHQTFEKFADFLKSAIMQSLWPFQNRHLGSKIKISKNLSKSIPQVI